MGTRTPRGREAQARRNDVRILAAALEVFTADVAAPMSAVAAAAGVGQASLYRRYPNRETLLSAVCDRGLTALATAAREAQLAPDPWEALRSFLEYYVDSGAIRLARLLGTFVPGPALFDLATSANRDMQRLVDNAVAAKAVRPDVTGADLTLIAVQLDAIDVGDPERTGQLRRRYLALALESLATVGAAPLPGPAPTGAELEAPWRALR